MDAPKWWAQSACKLEEGDMEAVKVFERKDAPLDWEYDDEAETLYLSFGKPKAPLASTSAKGWWFDSMSRLKRWWD
jgi:hypothetical protein